MLVVIIYLLLFFYANQNDYNEIWSDKLRIYSRKGVPKNIEQPYSSGFIITNMDRVAVSS